jgi:hypothetical protein
MPATGAMGSEARGAPGDGGAHDAPDGAGPQDSPMAAAGSDRIPVTDTTMVAKATSSAVTSEAAAGDPAASTSPAAGAPSSPPHMVAATASAGADDNAIEEPDVTMGHPGLRAPETVSLSKAMDTAHFALNQAHDVPQQEREDINEERLRLSVWVCLLKKRTTSEKKKAMAR